MNCLPAKGKPVQSLKTFLFYFIFYVIEARTERAQERRWCYGVHLRSQRSRGKKKMNWLYPIIYWSLQGAREFFDYDVNHSTSSKNIIIFFLPPSPFPYQYTHYSKFSHSTSFYFFFSYLLQTSLWILKVSTVIQMKISYRLYCNMLGRKKLNFDNFKHNNK